MKYSKEVKDLTDYTISSDKDISLCYTCKNLYAECVFLDLRTEEYKNCVTKCSSYEEEVIELKLNTEGYVDFKIVVKDKASTKLNNISETVKSEDLKYMCMKCEQYKTVCEPEAPFIPTTFCPEFEKKSNSLYYWLPYLLTAIISTLLIILIESL